MSLDRGVTTLSQVSMKKKQFIFIGGLHRSGTSLLHEMLRPHPAISGFANTGVPEDEGQSLQTVYKPAKAFGGPGRFGFDQASCMDETHPLATPESSEKLLHEWSQYWDLTKEYLVEKSPPNLVRTRFLQQLFPQCKFNMILCHPIAVAYATQKWSESSIPSLIEHSLRFFERLKHDMSFLNSIYMLQYEEFVLSSQRSMADILTWIGIDPVDFKTEIQQDVNRKYFSLWKSDRHIYGRI